MTERRREFVDSRLRRCPPDRASAVPMDKPGKTPCVSPALPTGRRLSTSFTAPQQQRIDFDSGKGETFSRLRSLAYSSRNLSRRPRPPQPSSGLAAAKSSPTPPPAPLPTATASRRPSRNSDQVTPWSSGGWIGWAAHFATSSRPSPASTAEASASRASPSRSTPQPQEGS